jgi:hypothetical protein
VGWSRDCAVNELAGGGGAFCEWEGDCYPIVSAQPATAVDFRC